MKKASKEVSKKKENIVAVLLGLVVIVVGFLLIWQLFNVSSEPIKNYAQHTFPKANIDMKYPTKWTEEDRTMLEQTVLMFSLRSVLYGFVVTILGLFSLKIFAFSGWVVIKKAANKSWYMAALPAVIVLLPYLFIFPNGVFGDHRIFVIEKILLLLFFLSALVGGWVAKHIQVK